MIAMCNIFKKLWQNNSVHSKIQCTEYRIHIEMAGVVWAVSLKRYSKCLSVWRREREELMCMCSPYWNIGNELFYLKIYLYLKMTCIFTSTPELTF